MAGVDEYTELLLHMDGVDDAQVFDDSSPNDFTITAVGNAKTENTQKKFGDTSGYFDGVGDYLSVPDSDFWYFDGDFTIDFWIRSDGSFGDNGIYGTSEGGGASKKMSLYLDSITGGSLTIHKNGPGGSFNVSWAWNPSDDTWYHVAIVRNGNSWYLFVDGVQTGGTQTQAGAFENVASTFRVGADGEGWKSFKGYIDEFRVSKGIARWTSNFTPPTAAYAVEYELTAEGGSYVITGADALLYTGYKITAGGGSYTLSGSAASLRKESKLAAGAGSYAITGQPVTIYRQCTLVVEGGVYAISGLAALLSHIVVSINLASPVALEIEEDSEIAQEIEFASSIANEINLNSVLRK